MASGNMGDLEFSLTLKSRVEDETRKVIQELNKVDASGKKAQEALTAIAEAVRSIDGMKHGNLEKVAHLLSTLEKQRDDIMGQEMHSLADLKTAKGLQSSIDALNRIDEIISSIAKSGKSGMSIFPNNIATEVNNAKRSIVGLDELLTKMYQKSGEGLYSLGVKETDNIRQAESVLSKYRSILEQIRNNGGVHPISGLTASDVTKSAEYINAINAAKAAVKELTEANKDAANEYDRQKRQREASKAAQEAELKAMSDYAKRYMELQEAKRKADEKATADAKRESKKRTAQVQSDTRKMSELYSILGVAKDKAEKVGMNGLALNVDTSKLEAKLKVAEDLMNRIFNENVKTLGLGGRMSSSDYATEVRNVKRALDDATASQKELNRAKEQSNKTNKREAEKKAAQDARDAANAEKQRQAEIRNSERRYNSLSNALVRLRSEFDKSVTLGVDTTKIDAKIHEVESKIMYVASIMNQLKGGDLSAIGQLGGIGTGRDITLANRLLSSQAAVNKEAAKGIEIEQKRQREIARSAAKVRSDLARGFERANTQAGKLNSTVQDLKSLFLQGGLVFGAQQFAMSIITTGGEMEKQHIALQSILGDMQNANMMFNQIKDLALNSPFTFSELNRDVKQLAAYGVEYEQLYDTTKRLADISSGLGVSFERIALAFGQVQARGWLDGKELRQIAYAGIPLLGKLSEFYSKREGKNVSTSEIKTRISKRDVSFDDVKSIFWEMTDAGGQFYNMQQTLSETLLGRYNKLKDAWEIMLAEFASGKHIVGNTLYGILELITSIVQNLHTIGPAFLAAFSGPMLKRGLVALEGGIGKSILSSKSNVASDITARVMQGHQISSIEKEILATKNQITAADIRNLAEANALTKADLRRLYLSGRITKEMYLQGMALAQQTNQVRQLSLLTAAKNLLGGGWSAAGGLLLGGLKSGIGAILGFFGGLPGIALSAGAFIYSYFSQKNAQLKQEMEVTAEELHDRYTKIGEFLRDNDADKAISGGDEKEILNLIDSYKEKLKEIAPEKANAFEMGAMERKSNEDRLKYLQEELRLLREVEKKTRITLGDTDTYKDLVGKFAEAQEIAEKYSDAQSKSKSINATNADWSRVVYMEAVYKREVTNMHNYLTRKLGDISKDPELQGEANQIMSSFFTNGGWDHGQAERFRADVLNSMGVSTGFYQDKFKEALENAINTAYPWIGDKIRNNHELTDAEKEQVTNMMKMAADQIRVDYPLAADALKDLLRSDKFEAVIRLTFSRPETDIEEQAGRNTVFAFGDEEGYHRRTTLSKRIAKGASGSEAKFRSDYESEVKKREDEEKTSKELLDKDKITAEEYANAAQALADAKQGFFEQFGEAYSTDNKKKSGKNTHQEDKALKDLKARIDLYKKMYAEIKKYKDLFGEGALEQLSQDGEFSAIFGDKKRFPISDYTNYETSIKELLSTLPTTTEDRKNYVNTEKAGIQTENRKLLAESRSDELAALNSQLDIIQEQYETYKKIYELTGNKQGAENIAFGGALQYGSNKEYLEGQLAGAVAEDNAKSGQSYSAEAVGKMSVQEVKSKYGEDTKTYAIRNRLEEQSKKLKSETINLLADLIEKNVTIAQQIEDENRKYERQLELIENIEDPQMKQRAKEGAEKSHNETTAKLQFEQFKQDSDWVAIFDDLDRVSTATINTMIDKINDFSKTTGLSVEVVKQLRDALDKLRDEHIERSPFSHIFGEVGIGNEIGGFIKSNFKKGAKPTATAVVSADQAKRWGLGEKGGKFKKSELEGAQRSAYSNSAKAVSKVAQGMQALSDVLQPVVGLFQAMGEEDSVLGQVTGGATNALTSAASTAGAFDTLSKAAGDGALGDALGSAGPYAAAAAAALSVGSSLISAFGANYSDYNKAKDEYNNLISTWDTLISKKKEYLSESWGTEAEKASKEARALLLSEIKQTKIIAQQRLESGSSAGSHSIDYRMWQGSYHYNGQNWQDVAKTISSKYGVRFNSMKDLLNMSSEILEKIKTDYSGLWAVMDEDFKEYLDKLIEYGDQVDEMTDTITEKLTGNSFTDLVSSWGEAMSAMSNSSDDLVEHFESNLKNAILKAMVQNIYGKQIEALMSKTKKYGENNDKITDSSGNVISEYTTSEMADIMKTTDDLSEQIEATRDDLKKRYGWSDDSSSSSTNSVKSITEDTADIIVSYVNGMRADLSMLRESQSKYLPEMSEIAKSQLSRLNLIAQNTLRNADAAERIEVLFTEYNDNFNRVLNGTKTLSVK